MLDEHVDRHRHEQQCQVRDRVAEQLHRRLGGGQLPQPHGHGNEADPEEGGRHDIEGAEMGHRGQGQGHPDHDHRVDQDLDGGPSEGGDHRHHGYVGRL